MNVGYNIKKIRELKGYDQKYMADQLDIHQTTYSRLESDPGKLSMTTLQKIADILEVDPLAIMAFDEKMVLNIGTQKNGDNSGGFVINNFPVKIQELYEARIKSLEEEVRFLHSFVNRIDIK